MKFYQWLALALLVLTQGAFASQHTVEIVEQFDNFRLIAFVEEADIAASPEWNADTEAPPLTVYDAIRAVKDFDPDLDSSNMVNEIELRPLPNNPAHWHYLIKITNEEMKSRHNIYIVLMNGKVIPAIVEPKA